MYNNNLRLLVYLGLGLGLVQKIGAGPLPAWPATFAKVAPPLRAVQVRVLTIHSTQ